MHRPAQKDAKKSLVASARIGTAWITCCRRLGGKLTRIEAPVVQLLLIPLPGQQRQPLLTCWLDELWRSASYAHSTIPAGRTVCARGERLSVSPFATRATSPLAQMSVRAPESLFW